MTPMARTTADGLVLLSGTELAVQTACVLQSEKLILVLDQFRLQKQQEQSENHYSIDEARQLVEKLPKHEQEAEHYLRVAIGHARKTSRTYTWSIQKNRARC